MSTPNYKKVTTSFLLASRTLLKGTECEQHIDVNSKFETDNEKLVLIFKRSELVSSFKNYWAGCSGSFESNESALQTALREIFEETALEQSNVTLIRVGKTLTVASDTDNKIFLVYPFLFEINSLPNGICLNFEHTTYKFVSVWEINSTNSYRNYVPLLSKALWRTFIPEGALKLGLGTIIKDREHGATQIASLGINLMRKIGDTIKLDYNFLDYYNYYLEFGRMLVCTRKSMAPLRNAICTLLNNVKNSAEINSKEDFVSNINNLVDNYEILKEKNQTELDNNLLNLLTTRCNNSKDPKKFKVFLHSYSSTISRAISNAALSLPKSTHIIIAESRPLFEGVKTAASIMTNSPIVNCTIITDAQASIFIPECDIILLGADTILCNGTLINKTGSCLFAAIGKYLKLPVYVVAESNKFLTYTPSSNFELEELETEEITKFYSLNYIHLPPQVLIRNVYFDKTPLDLITGFVTENGIIDSKEVNEIISKLEASDVFIE